MKTLTLGKNKSTTVLLMSDFEFKRFMAGKRVYHFKCNWIEKWHADPVTENYFPYKGFIIPAGVTLKPYAPGYGSNAFSSTTTDDVSIYELPFYHVTLKENVKNGYRWCVTPQYAFNDKTPTRYQAGKLGYGYTAGKKAR